MLKIYNSLTKQKETFVPLVPGKVGLYVCGLTVYDYCHIGHARMMMAFDVIVRYLRSCGYQVTYVRNITDIDDKIIHRAEANQEAWTQLTERFIAAMHTDLAQLNILPPDQEPRATAHIAQIIALITQLLDKGIAYQAENGDVYYDVTRFPAYGALAHQDVENLKAGARIAITEVKRHPLDFVLWKTAKPGEPSWPSPFGEGRPGWHIECSAMSMHCLGQHFDIHGGGFDLTFPHHENEIAQSEAATGKKFVNTWMHVGFVQINEEKMSKSLGNFFTVRQVLAQYVPEVVRYFLLSSHYRSPLNYSEQSLDYARASLERLYLALRDLPKAANINVASATVATVAAPYQDKFNAAMADDFNTPEALAVLFELTREINKLRDEGQANLAVALAATLRELAGILGLLQADPMRFLQTGDMAQEAEIVVLIQQREQARADKQFAQADSLRDQLWHMGIVLEDTARGTIWRRR